MGGDFSLEMMHKSLTELRLQGIERKTHQLKILYPTEIVFRNKGTADLSDIKAKMSPLLLRPSRNAKGALQAEGKDARQEHQSDEE